MAALELTYEDYIEINGGEHCGVCGKKPSDNRRLDRDHDHRTGQPRGLLCHRHNMGLRYFSDDPELMEAGAAYLRRARESRPAQPG